MKQILFSFLILLAASHVQAQPVPVTTGSDAARAHFEDGRLAAAHADFAKARTHLDAAIEADPAFALAHLYRAAVSPAEERQAHLQQAKAHAGAASDGERMMVEWYEVSLGEDDARELELLGAIAERYPEDPYPHFHAGWSLYAQERYPEATAALDRALAVDPDFAPAYNLLGYAALAQEDHVAAERAFKSYVRLAPGEANPYDSLGELYLNMERYAEAAEQFEMALARDPDFTVSRDNLIRAGIGQSNQRFEAAVGLQDAAALAALYTEDGRLAPPDSPVIIGRDAIQAYWTAVFASGVDGSDLTTSEVYGMGDTATELGDVKIRAGGVEIAKARYTVVWQQDGGTWRLHRDIWNSDVALTAVTN